MEQGIKVIAIERQKKKKEEEVVLLFTLHGIAICIPFTSGLLSYTLLVFVFFAFFSSFLLFTWERKKVK